MNHLPRTRENYLAVIALERVETNPLYARRDVTGDGKPETFCNLFVSNVTKALGCPIPWKLANDQFTWLISDQGRATGWIQIESIGSTALVELGAVVIAIWCNPGGQGHVAMVVPSPDGAGGLFIAQAGRHNFSCEPLEKGFGNIRPSFFGHL